MHRFKIQFDPAVEEPAQGDVAGGEAVETVESNATPAKPSFDRDALESKIAGKLEDIFDEENGIVDENDDQPADDKGEDEPVVGEEKPETGEEEDEAAAEVSADPNAPTLPDAYRRSLKAYGWEDAEIDQNLKVLGAKFVETAQKLHTNRNAEVNQWAEAGRQARQQQTPAPTQTQTQQPATTGAFPIRVEPIDTKKLVDVYGDEELVKAIVGPVNATIAAMNAILPTLNESLSSAKQAEEQRLVQEIQGFFGGKEIVTGYSELYGDGKSAVTPAQQANRNAVLDQAEALMYGASRQGRTLSVKEALALAHDSVSVPFRETAIKKGITKTAKDRNRGITIKPTAKGARPATGNQPRSRAELESKIGNMLKNLS